MLSIFRKKIGDDVIKWDWINTIIKGKDMISFFFLKATPRDPMVWCLNYLNESIIKKIFKLTNCTLTINNFVVELTKDSNNINIKTLLLIINYINNIIIAN
jgi:hypothetical protein